MSDDLSIPNSEYRGNRAGRYGTGQGRVQGGMDPDTRRLIIFAGGLGVVLALLIAASTLVGHRSSDVPVITADSRPIRVKPENPGGMKIDGAENDVFSGGSDTADSKLAPPSENPDAKAMHLAATSSPPPGATHVPAANSPAEPTAKPAAAGSSPAAAEPHPSAPGQQPVVQLAALTSEEAARHEWQQLSKRMPELMNGRQPVFARVERGGHTFWRVRATGFTDLAQARSFCAHVRAKGGGCSVADF